MNKEKFFSNVRTNIFNGRLSQSKVDGLNAIMDAAEKLGVTDIRMLAYAMATPVIETGGTYEPVTESLNYSVDALLSKFPNRISADEAKKYGRTSSQPANQEMIGNIIYGGEWGRKNLGNTNPGDGFKYLGRGLVQLTGRRLYGIFGYLDNPQDAAHVKDSALVMVKGMRDGTFTGKKFSDYFNSAPPDWVNARRMVNGTDRAADIAKFAVQYYDALRAAA